MNVISKLYIKYLLHKRAYSKIISFTNFDFSDKDVDRDKIHYQAYVSYFQKNFFHSQKCLEILQERNIINSEESCLLAFLYARHNEKENAILMWCSSLELNKNNSLSSKALDYIKDQGRDLNLFEDDFFHKPVIREPLRIPYRIITLVVLILVMVSGIYYFWNDLINLYDISRHPDYNNIEQIVIKDYDPSILDSPKKTKQPFSYSEDEIKQIFNRIKRLIISEDYDQAQVEINRIYLSNASLNVRVKTEILETYLIKPDYAVFENVFTLDDVTVNPALYHNVFIKWKGRVVNKKVFDDHLTFDLVVGDIDKGEVSALIPVLFKRAVIIDNNDILEIFGRIDSIDREDFIILGENIIRGGK